MKSADRQIGVWKNVVQWRKISAIFRHRQRMRLMEVLVTQLDVIFVRWKLQLVLNYVLVTCRQNRRSWCCANLIAAPWWPVIVAVCYSTNCAVGFTCSVKSKKWVKSWILEYQGSADEVHKIGLTFWFSNNSEGWPSCLWHFYVNCQRISNQLTHSYHRRSSSVVWCELFPSRRSAPEPLSHYSPHHRSGSMFSSLTWVDRMEEFRSFQLDSSVFPQFAVRPLSHPKTFRNRIVLNIERLVWHSTIVHLVRDRR